MKRIAALLLALILCCGIASAAGDAAIAENAGTLTTMQRAVVETALAYHNRGAAVQYDSVNMTIQSKYAEPDGSDLRETDFISPEDATADKTMFSVCSAYCFEVYYDAFGYQLSGSPLECKTFKIINDFTAEDPICVLKFDGIGKETGPKIVTDKDTACAKAKEVLQPGDVIVGYGSKPDSGHALMYIGDYLGDGKTYVSHCWGSKYDIESGSDSTESYKEGNGGAIRIQECWSASGAPWTTADYDRFVILRPLNVLKESDMTENAKARLQYPGINIDRTADHNRFKSAAPGEEITVTVAIQNCSAKDYAALPVTEIIPAGAALKADSVSVGGKENSGKLEWTLNIPAGKTETVSYTVTVTGKRGETVKLTGGNVGGIRDNDISVPVSGAALSPEAQTKLKNIGDSYKLLQDRKLTGSKFADTVYQEILGLDVTFPAVADVANGAFTPTEVNGADKKMYVKNDSDAGAMIVPCYFGGRMVRTGGNGHARVLEFKGTQLLPGDVLLAMAKGNPAAVVIGDGKVAYLDKDKLSIGKLEKFTAKFLTYDFFVALRPTLADDDVNARKAAVKMPFTDVKEGDWFYEFVKELYGKGIVNGMTETTFVPNGKLTYGQALKLIVCGLGKGEQAATGSHWASGYLTFAKAQKWLDKNVDLNGPISRLQFCQIAAKAKGLTAQPASNPFKDCADKDVLALVNAGIINGMSADTFAPDSTLTRAQISKIISGLIQ